MSNRPEKNSERVEVRTTYNLKQRFLKACKTAGDTPSEALRGAMADYILRVEAAGKPNPLQELTMKLIHNPLKTAGMALASLAAFAMIAAPSSADERFFNALDLDEDGAISAADLNKTDRIILRVLDADGSETITLDEFKLVTKLGQIIVQGNVEITANTVTVDEENQRATYGTDVNIDYENSENEGFELRLPDGADWGADTSSLNHSSSEGGPVDIKFDVQQANIITIDLSEVGRIQLTTERVSLEDFEPEALGTVIVDLQDAENAP